MNELDKSFEQDRCELFWYFQTSASEPEMSCDRGGNELCGTKIKVRSQQRIPPNSLFANGGKLEASCN